jgi:GTP-binding protein Era
MNDNAQKRAGMIAIVGRANVGKSTLINRILDEKISIVSPIAQTTRNLIRGVLTEPRGQLVFLDTPGVHKASYDLGRLMNGIARTSIEGVDIVLLVFDVSEPPQIEDDGWIRRLLFEETACVAVLNKTERGPGKSAEYRKLWDDLAKEKGVSKTPTWMSISGATGQGVNALVDLLFQVVPEGPQLFPEDVLTDFPRKLAMADIVREKYFAVLRDELPHALAVEIEEIHEREADWDIQGIVYVQKSSQKGIVLGNKGRLLRKVQAEAEKEIGEIYGHRVSLDLWVKVQKDWSRNFWFLKRLGYAG